MSSRREEERNEKIIRGLMKLPPNRRCINCNSLGPQYVCTNFWTFVCTTCSGIHREFTHRVKSVSMAKFTSQEVDALQRGGNQRAREIYLKAWDPQKNRLPDNSNIDKVRDFIKKVYVDKLYFQEKSSDRPPRDPQSLRSQEDETRRASSYHSYSQSPPYDYQYEERRYGKHAPALTRKPGSDRGLYAGKLGSFLSPTRSADLANDESFSNEGSHPRFSDFSVSGGGDPYRSDALSPSSQRGTGSPFSETSRDISSEVPPLHNVLQSSDAVNRSNGGKVLHPQTSESFGSFDSNSMSFKSVNSLDLPEVGVDSEQCAQVSLDKFASFPSVPQSSVSKTFDELDLFNAPFAPQNVTSIPPYGGNTQLPHSSLTQPVNAVQDNSSAFSSITQSSVTADELDFFSTTFTQQTSAPASGSSNTQLPSQLAQSVNVVHEFPISSVPTFTGQQPSQNLQPASLDLFAEFSEQQSAASSNGKAEHMAMPNNGGWATFDMSQKTVSMGTENSSPAAVLSSDGNVLAKFNPFSVDETSSYIAPSGNKPSALSTHTLGHQSLHNVEAIINQAHSWSAFDHSSGGQPIQNVISIDKRASDAEKSLGFGVYEALNKDVNLRTTNDTEPHPSSLLPHLSMTLNDFPMVSAAAGVHSFATDHKPSNPFDLPSDTDMESSNMFWNMSSLQAALQNTQSQPPYAVNQSWDFHNSAPSYAPSGVPFGPTSGSLGFMAGQAPSNQVSNIHAQGPVASVGGNPFA